MQILSQTEVWQWPDWCIIIASISGCLFIIFLVALILLEVYLYDAKPWMIFMCGISVVALLFSVFQGVERYGLHHIDYKVLLSVDYPAKNFFDKYELLGIEGDIYEIREYINEEKIDET